MGVEELCKANAGISTTLCYPKKHEKKTSKNNLADIFPSINQQYGVLWKQ